MSEMVKIESLPRSLQDASVDSCVLDAMNLAQLLEGATTRMQRLSGLPDDQRADRDSLWAFLWMATDLVDLLRWKLERVELGHAKGE